MKRVNSSLLIAFFPLVLVLVELGVAVGSNFLLIHDVGGNNIPAYIKIPPFILCTFVSFQAALFLTRKIYEFSQTRRAKIQTSMVALFSIILLGGYGCLRLEFPGMIVYEWDAIVDCCTPAGEVSGIYIILSSCSAVFGMMCYTTFRFIHRIQRRNKSACRTC